MSDPFEEGPICDFCEIAVDEGETLEPIFIGELEEPEPHYLTGIAQRGGYDATRYKGKYHALRKALYDCRDVELNESNGVEEVQQIGGSMHTYESKINNSKVGASIKIQPKPVEYEPDAMVCDTCAEMFKGLGD